MNFAEIIAAVRRGYGKDGTRAVTDGQLDALRGLLAPDGDSDGLSDEDLEAANLALVELFDAARAAGDLATMRALAADAEMDGETVVQPAGLLTVIGDELAVREAAEADAQAEADALAARVHGSADDATDDDGGDGGDGGSQDEDGDEDAAEDSAPAPVAEMPAAPVVEAPVAVAASGRRAPLSRVRRPDGRGPAPQHRSSRAHAGADVPGHSAGAPMESQQVGEAFGSKVDAISKLRSRGAVGRWTVATFKADFPESRQLGDNPSHNGSLIAAALVNEDGQSLTAAGGLCAPVAIDYGQMRIDTEVRPLRDALTSFQATRGGITFVPPPQLSDINVASVTDGTWDDDDTAVAVWTEAVDGAAPGNGHVKPFQTITCAESVTVEVDAVTARLRIGNFSRRTFSEQWDAFWGLTMSAHSRAAENRLWELMKAVTRNIQTTHAQALGATRDLLAGLDQALAAFRYINRMPEAASLRVLLPSFVRDMMRADLARQLAGDSTLGVTNAQMDQWFQVRNANVSWLLDAGSTNVFAAQTAGALVAFPGTVEAIIYPEGSFLFLDGGQLDLGVELRDSTLIDTNDVEAFIETFEQVAFVGVDARTVAFSVCPDGTAQGTVSAEFCGS